MILLNNCIPGRVSMSFSSHKSQPLHVHRVFTPPKAAPPTNLVASPDYFEAGPIPIWYEYLV